MKLQLLQTSKPSPPSPDHQDEMNRLYERLTTNAYSDSESVRQTILGRMIFLLYQRLPK
jgi:hypothetical protein